MKSNCTWASWAIVATWSAAVMAGCAGSDEKAATEQPIGVGAASDDAARDGGFDAYALAWEYKYGEKDPSDPTRVLDTIRALPLEHARAFHSALADIHGITGELLSLVQAGFEVAAEHGVSFIDLDAEMHAEAFRRTFPNAPEMSEPLVEMSTEPQTLDEPQPVESAQVEKQICFPGFASCQVDPNFANGYAMFGGSCAGGCVAASSVDRLSNASCELGGCDYRITFPGPVLQLLDGRTAAGDCAIGAFPDGIGAYSAFGATFAQLGFNRVLINCLISGSEVNASLFLAFR
jgi:hypothetical protein